MMGLIDAARAVRGRESPSLIQFGLSKITIFNTLGRCAKC